MERDGGTWSSRQMDTCLEAGWETAPLGPPAPGIPGVCLACVALLLGAQVPREM